MRSMYEDTYALLRPCPLCESRLGLNLGTLCFKNFDQSPISGSVSLVVCSLCGFAFYDTSNTQADFDRYYQQNAYYCTAVTTGSGGASRHDTMRFDSLFQRIAAHIPSSDAAIFDVGCARGGLLSILAQRGFSHLYGVDMVPECVSFIRDTLGMLAETGSALELPFPDVQADVLVYSHVVEHVINLSSLVATAYRKLSDRGILYVEVPDASRYGEYTNNPYQDLYLEHVNHFDMSTLSALFGAGGFEAVSTGRYELEASSVGKVPCVWAIFRKGAVISLEKSELALETHLREYLSWSGHHPALTRFRELEQSKTPIYLWGISQYAMLLMGQTPLRNCDIRGFVDKDASKRMRTLIGKSIDSPDVLSSAERGCGVLVTAPGYEGAIAAALRSMGFNGDVLTASGEVMILK